MISALRSRCRAPIGAGDAMTGLGTLLALLAADALDVVRLDITQLGGVGPLQTAMAFASLYGRPVSPHIYPEVSQHLAFARPGVSFVEMFPDDSPFWRTERFVRSDLDTRLERGRLSAPTQPGVGIEIDWSVVSAHPPEPT
jgi:galactonate dehydratase